MELELKDAEGRIQDLEMQLNVKETNGNSCSET